MEKSGDIWKKVAATVRPFHERDITLREVLKGASEQLDMDAALTAAMATRKPRFTFAARPERVIPKAVRGSLDLHGLTVNDAYLAAVDYVSSTKRKSVTIITGKSGQIKREFTRWVENLPMVHSVVEKSDGGAYTVRILKRFR